MKIMELLVGNIMNMLNNTIDILFFKKEACKGGVMGC